MFPQQNTRNIYHKQINKIRSGSNASTTATTSGFTIAGIGQPILTTTAASTTTIQGNDIGNLTQEVENNVENSTVDNTPAGNNTTEMVPSIKTLTRLKRRESLYLHPQGNNGTLSTTDKLESFLESAPKGLVLKVVTNINCLINH